MARSEKYSSVGFVGINYFTNPGQDKYGPQMSSQDVKKVEKETNSVFMSKTEHKQELEKVRRRKKNEENKRFDKCISSINEKIYKELDV